MKLMKNYSFEFNTNFIGHFFRSSGILSEFGVFTRGQRDVHPAMTNFYTTVKMQNFNEINEKFNEIDENFNEINEILHF